MLAYAFRELRLSGFEKCGSEDFEKIDELFAEILAIGIEYLAKRGFEKDYILHNEKISGVKGKICLDETMRQAGLLQNKLVCEYDQYSLDIILNQILKSTGELILRSGVEKGARDLRTALRFFGEVRTIDLKKFNWRIRYNRNNDFYRALIFVCYLYCQHKLLNDSQSEEKSRQVMNEEAMSTLYENFVLEYFRQEYPQLSAEPSRIKWGMDETDKWLPDMITDITLTNREKKEILIIDTKYYKKIFGQKYSDSQEKFNSHNLYQIFSYVENKKFNFPDHKVSGMLLYAMTNNEVDFVEKSYKIVGDDFFIDTLNLGEEFSQIKMRLDKIAEKIL